MGNILNNFQQVFPIIKKKFMNLICYTYFNFSNIIIYILQNRKSIKINISFFFSNQLKKLNLI